MNKKLHKIKKIKILNPPIQNLFIEKSQNQQVEISYYILVFFSYLFIYL